MPARSSTDRLRRVARVCAIPLAFGIAACIAPARQYHWDTLERAYLLEHPARYLRTWDGTPRSQFLSFAHVLELPLAAIVRAAAGGVSGLRALCILEGIAAMASLVLAGALVLWWRTRTGSGSPRDALWATLSAQATLAVAVGFWRMGSSGEEKILALATQLLALGLFWRALWIGTRAGPESGRAQRTTRAATWAAAALAFAILVHLSAAVLVPFAALALAWLPATWRPARRTVSRALACGAAVALVIYAVIAAWTTHVRTPRELWEYLTFFHRADGIDFFDAGAGTLTAWERLRTAWHGFGSFFAATAWAQSAVIVALAAALAAPLWWRRRDARRTPAHEDARRVLTRHATLLAVLWTAHFLFFEPENPESWTMPAALAVIVAAAALPGRTVRALSVLPLALGAINAGAYAALRAPLPYAPYRSVIERGTRPEDIVILTGGTQGGQALRGSLVMRYFLAVGPARQYASLYDVVGVSGREYWDAPFREPAALQAALDAGRRVLVPLFVRAEIDRATASGIVHIETAPAGDSLFAITRIEAREQP